MRDKRTLLIISVALLFWYLMASNSAATTANTSVMSQRDCVAAVQAQTGGQWANMSYLERAMAGMQASGCGR